MNKRKFRVPILFLALFAVLVTALIIGVIGCDVSITIEQRVEYFFSDLNSARDRAYQNFKTTDPLDGDAIKDPLFWAVDFPVDDGTPYTYGSLNTSTPSNVTATVDGPPAFLGPKTVRFVMVQEGMDWYIQELYLNGNPIIPTP